MNWRKKGKRLKVLVKYIKSVVFAKVKINMHVIEFFFYCLNYLLSKTLGILMSIIHNYRLSEK